MSKKDKTKKLTNSIEETRDDFDHIVANILMKNNVIHTIDIDPSEKGFLYNKKHYSIDSSKIYLLPKKDTFELHSFYVENNLDPLLFEDKNEGILARALHLLWNHTLYRVLVTPEGDKTNLIIIIMLGINIIFKGIELYIRYGEI